MHCTARRELQIGFASRSGMERPAVEGDSPVSESDPTPDRVPEYHVEGLSCGNPGGPPSKAKYSWRPIVNEYREGKVKSTPIRGVKQYLKPRAHKQSEGVAGLPVA